jgi:eukaryotic-like serine/threonine-protein kinase
VIVVDPRRPAADPLNATLSADPSSSPVRHEQDPSWGAAPVRDPARYEFLNEHGRGGLGRVSRARDKDFGRDIAIKELLSRGHLNELRFVREAMITARLEHPGIVPVYEAGRWPDGTPFYAMKLVSGRPLRALIAERKTVDERIGLLHHVIAVADAIAYAHGRSIIHRDLKPANVIVGDFGETVVIDWGLAKDLSDSAELPRGAGSPADGGLTSAGAILGTPTYMSPEQERGEAVDQRADVFAIGAMLWELCAVRKAPPADLGQRYRMLRRAGIESDLVTIINKALDPDPARRYLDAGELAADLKAFKSGSRIAGRSYSPWAMLVHWMRRHRALALAITAAVALAAAGTIVFVRNIAVERDRADRALVTAQQERDRAKLSEAALVLDRDPNRAASLLSSFAVPTPQVSMLTSRARQRSAIQILKTSATIDQLYRALDGATVEIRMADGELDRLDLRTGARTVLDHDMLDAITYRDGQPLYVQHPRGAPGWRIKTPSGGEVLEIETLGGAAQLVALRDAMYVLDDAGEVHRLDGTHAPVIDRGVRGIAGEGDLLLTCRLNGVLDVQRAGAVVQHKRCAQSKSLVSMAVAGGDYAALGDDGVLVAHRGERTLEIQTGVLAEHEIALSGRGVIGVAEYGASSRSWFMRANGTRLEPGPVYASPTFGVAVDGDLVAWGYVDGTVIARDTVTGMAWEFHGHTDTAQRLVIDAAHARLISASQRELRVWDLSQTASTLAATMPCSSFHIEPSADASQAALDCDDGSVRVWSRRTGGTVPIDKHAGYAYGVQWVGDLICSGGWGEGHVQCASRDGTQKANLDSASVKINSMTTTPDHRSLIFGAADGKVWRFDGTFHTLYAHGGNAQRVAVSADARLLASCARDGSITVFDLVANRTIASRFSHAGAYCDVSWVGHELWSSADEGTLKRWTVTGDDLKLAHMVQASSSLRMLKVLGDGWAAVEGTTVLLVSRDGASVALRIDAGKRITAIDVSADRRYVVASMDGEILAIDQVRNSVATLAIGAPILAVRFLEPAVLAFSEPTALKTLHVDQLDYVPFVPAPEPPNRVSF